MTTRRMRSRVRIRPIVHRRGLAFSLLTLALIHAPAARALDISVEFDLGLSQFANPVARNAANEIGVDYVAGDVVVIDIVVSNPTADLISLIFAQLIVDSTQLGLLGGSYFPILDQGSCTGFLCSPPTLVSIFSAPQPSVDSPLLLGTGTELWFEVPAHGLSGGTTGTGPDVAATLAFSIVADQVGSSPIDIRIGRAPGLGGGILVPGAPMQPFEGPVNFSGAVINVPEPGTALLVGLGLIGLVAAGRRREAGPSSA